MVYGITSQSSMYNPVYWPNGINNRTYMLNPYMNSAFGSNYIPGMLNGDFASYLDGNSYSSLLLFNMYLKNKMPMSWQHDAFNKTYNTKTNLPALKDIYNPRLSNKLANIAEKNASRTNTIGLCAKGTNDSLQIAGLAKGETRVSYAYQAAERLARHKNFKEVKVSREDLKNLPAGCVVVWDRARDGSANNPYASNRLSKQYGHITITLGKDSRGVPQEASDHVTDMLMLNTAYRTFVPVEG